MTFKKTVLAYLTGWVIAQAAYNRITADFRIREREAFINEIADELESRLGAK